MKRDENERIKYYLLYDSIIGKQDETGYFIFRNGEWNHDTECEIIDCLYGFDPSEPSDSPYAYVSTSMLDQIKEITTEQAMELLDQQEK